MHGHYIFSMTHKEVIEITQKFLDRKKGKRWSVFLTFSEIVTIEHEIPDIIGFASGSSTIIEVKISRSDFLKDKKKSFRYIPQLGMGNYRFYACPDGLIKESEIPENWGLIYINKKKKCEIIKEPERQISNTFAEHRFMYSILRRLKLQKIL